MRLKEYQDRALNKFLAYWGVLRDCYNEAQKRLDSKRKSRPQDRHLMDDFASASWERFIGRRDAHYVRRVDAREEFTPHVCIKIPTGGGKTLMGVSVLERVRMQEGLVLWIVPTKAIFAQTWKALANRMHPYRQSLERACGGRVKLLRKGESFSREDTEHFLCVMPLMLQATGGGNGEKDFYKIFRDTGKYPGFFPKEDDFSANRQLAEAHPDLKAYDLADGQPGQIKQSLYNALKLARPFIVLDEAQYAYSEAKRRRLGEFNPRFVLELSATPNPAVSNILINVSGKELKRENMIKLPLNIHNFQEAHRQTAAKESGADKKLWQFTLDKAKAKLKDLDTEAESLRAETGKYIRPIMLIRVERVGRKQRDGGHIHAEDVREDLINRLGVDPRHIRYKTSEKDEIADEDLLSEYCEVRYILTKDALKEGWDCAFAYVLTLLDSTRAANTLTQMTGRVLRQPHAELTGRAPLDQSYVFCFNANVRKAMNSVKKGLETEGLSDLEGVVRNIFGAPGIENKVERIIKRRQEFNDLQIFLPQTLCRDGNQHRPLSYERDILAALDWETIGDSDIEFGLGTPQGIREITAQVDLLHSRVRGDRGGMERDERTDLEFFARRIADVIPNPWVAARIVDRVLDSFRKQNIDEKKLFAARYNLSEFIKRRLEQRVYDEAERVFCAKLKSREILFELRDNGQFQIPDEMHELIARRGESMLLPLEKSLFEAMPAKHFNELECDFAICLDGNEAVQWWHRFVARRSEYFLQGWTRNRVYPDFVLCAGADGKSRRMFVLETKGTHLVGNRDTEYKKALMAKLEEELPHAMECGALHLQSGKKLPLLLRIVEEDGWRETADNLLS